MPAVNEFTVLANQTYLRGPQANRIGENGDLSALEFLGIRALDYQSAHHIAYAYTSDSQIVGCLSWQKIYITR